MEYYLEYRKNVSLIHTYGADTEAEADTDADASTV